MSGPTPIPSLPHLQAGRPDLNESAGGDSVFPALGYESRMRAIDEAGRRAKPFEAVVNYERW
jgi:hypothetical protein